MVNHYMLYKALDKIKEIGIVKFDDTKTLIDTDDKLPDITFKNIVILNTMYH